MGPIRSNEYLETIDSNIAWNIHFLSGVSKKIGFPNIFQWVLPKKKIHHFCTCISGHPHLQIMFLVEAVPTWPQLAAVIPTLNVPGRSSSLDDKACWGGDSLPPKILRMTALGGGLVGLEEIFWQTCTCKYGCMVSGCCLFFLVGGLNL